MLFLSFHTLVIDDWKRNILNETALSRIFQAHYISKCIDGYWLTRRLKDESQWRCRPPHFLSFPKSSSVSFPNIFINEFNCVGLLKQQRLINYATLYIMYMAMILVCLHVEMENGKHRVF